MKIKTIFTFLFLLTLFVDTIFSQGKPYEVSKQFWRRGQINPNVQQYYSFNFFGLQQIVNPIDTLYTTPTHSLDIDDSYFFNK